MWFPEPSAEMTVTLANIAVGIGIIDGLEFAIRRAWIPDLYLSHVLMAAFFGMCVLNLIGAHFDRGSK
jgi:hypothetical protein